MQSIIISGFLIANTVEITYDGEGVPKSGTAQLLLTTGIADKSVTAPVPIHCYGSKAQQLLDFDNTIDKPVIVEGSPEYEDKVFLHIQNASVYIGSPKLKLNLVNIAGNTGRTPEAKLFESGRNLAEFSVAVNRRKNVTDWFSITLWGKPASIAADYLNKGDRVAITGKLDIQQWTDKEGILQTRFKITGDKLSLLGQQQQKQQQNHQSQQNTAQANAYAYDDF